MSLDQSSCWAWKKNSTNQPIKQSNFKCGLVYLFWPKTTNQEEQAKFNSTQMLSVLNISEK